MYNVRTLVRDVGDSGVLSRKTRWILGIAALYVLLDAQTSWAWGPAVHVKLAGDLLANLTLLPAAIAALIGRHVRDYLYGSLATDVVFAKRLSRVKQFCHHWSTGFRLLEQAEDDRGRAFAYGYLSHLAADTVAHGKFLPYQIMTTGTTLSFGHLYWEVRADAAVGEHARSDLESAMLMDHAAHHAVLGRVLTDTFLPYEINRVLFARINALAANRGWRRSMAVWGRWSPRLLPADLLAQYHAECFERTICLLRHGPRSPLLHEDPSGTSALAFAAEARRGWRRRVRRGWPLHHRTLEAAAGHAPRPWLALGPPPVTALAAS